MTIAAAYLTSEGVVLGADSTTTISQTGGAVVQLLDHAQKVYEIGERSHFGLCTFGSGRAGPISHRTISARLGDWMVGKDPTVMGLAQELVGLLTAQASAAGTIPFAVGYFIGGTDPDHEPKCVRVEFSFTGPDASGKPAVSTTTTPLVVGQASFDGAPDYFTRVFHGFAPGLPEAILAELQKILAQHKALPPDLDKLFMEAFGQAQPKFASTGFNDLPLREAIDYIHTYLAVTIKAFKFRYGPPPCGGPIEIAYISSDRPFRWARHKRFDSAIAEHQEPL